MRKVARAYHVPPFWLLDVPEIELAAEAELLDVEDEIAQRYRDDITEQVKRKR